MRIKQILILPILQAFLSFLLACCVTQTYVTASRNLLSLVLPTTC